MKQNKNILELAKVIKDLNSEIDVVNFLEGILSPKELIEISQRLQVVKKLKQGTPQRLIAKELNVGIATVTRGSKEIQKGRFKNV